jgi:hypothetical protein
VRSRPHFSKSLAKEKYSKTLKKDVVGGSVVGLFFGEKKNEEILKKRALTMIFKLFIL